MVKGKSKVTRPLAVTIASLLFFAEGVLFLLIPLIIPQLINYFPGGLVGYVADIIIVLAIGYGLRIGIKLAWIAALLFLVISVVGSPNIIRLAFTIIIFVLLLPKSSRDYCNRRVSKFL